MDILCEQCCWVLEKNGDGSRRLCTICRAEYKFTSEQSASSAAATTTTTAISQQDTIVYPSDNSNNIEFPDDNEVGDADEFTNAVPWRDIWQNVWLYITDINNVNTVHSSMIVTLRQRGSDEIIKD